MIEIEDTCNLLNLLNFLNVMEMEELKPTLSFEFPNVLEMEESWVTEIEESNPLSHQSYKF